MDKFYFVYLQHRYREGWSLIELLIALSIVGILFLITMHGVKTSRNSVAVLEVKNYLLSLQTIQSKAFLQEGKYKSLHEMPKLNLERVSIEELSKFNKQARGYVFAATFDFLPKQASCRTLVIEEGARLPNHCW